MAARLAAFAAVFLAQSKAFDFGDVETQPSDHAQASARPAAVFGTEDESMFTLEHALADGAHGERVWTKRATFSYREAPRYVAVHTRQAAVVRLAPASLDEAELRAFGELVTEGNAYSIRVPSVLNDPASRPVVASVPACGLLRSHGAELLTLQIDTAGTVVALGYALPEAGAPCDPGTWQMPSSLAFNTSVSVHAPVDGPLPRGRPDAGAGPAGKGGGGGKGGESGGEEAAPPKSFVQRYWYYILPAMVVMLLGGGDPPAEAGAPGARPGVTGPGGGGGGGGGAARAPARRA
ncbi:hypothetical protein KFE25_003974 [Diacronema lutheri]|uniref:ER membrane protein complex subunit 10 n=1 Tax=Diacronema lutheri TaxID=2081491 RepID=A0A8J6CA48_DIALT|nr:hypothetical protein KFE25_003974 [Diacronema lutheri]|mmetsp:Transcript_20462/g.63600  ORF Transcript_20462/g.63600 Transcript_20462/m.63600 type:complete len:293 (-) Transcript_20462:7-885(-)